ncbi:TPA: hypothetical protein HA239_05005 [Candidatus Woesearchaeota archaeon]|nr:hypothetical protein QT06_C0001G0339 [archaeon GW2011_AR15]MBS3103656.1 hypothetical protein [Candidatus Woesearchaeota archaeon]HIH41742.1 hypothetical protein [Candidatus Woesearchaeota archaeon]
MAFWDKGKKTVEYLDSMSNGLVSRIIPKDANFRKRSFASPSGFFMECKSSSDSVYLSLKNAEYPSPLGRSGISIATSSGYSNFLEREAFESSFSSLKNLNKAIVDLDRKYEGLLGMMANNPSEKMPNPMNIAIILSGSSVTDEIPGRATWMFEIFSDKGRFEAIGEFFREGIFKTQPQTFNVDNAEITLKNHAITAAYIYGLMDRKKAEKETKKLLESELKSMEGISQLGLEVLSAEIEGAEMGGNTLISAVISDGAGQLRLQKSNEPKYILGKSYSKRKRELESYGVHVKTSGKKTTLEGSIPLIVRLGRELSGIHNYGLLSQQ